MMIHVAITAINANCQRGILIVLLYSQQTFALATPKEAADTKMNISAVRMKSTNSGVFKAFCSAQRCLSAFVLDFFLRGNRVFTMILPTNNPTIKYKKQQPNIQSFVPNTKLSNLPIKTRRKVLRTDLALVFNAVKANMKISQTKLVMRPIIPREVALSSQTRQALSPSMQRERIQIMVLFKLLLPFSLERTPQRPPLNIFGMLYYFFFFCCFYSYIIYLFDYLSLFSFSSYQLIYFTNYGQIALSSSSQRAIA